MNFLLFILYSLVAVVVFVVAFFGVILTATIAGIIVFLYELFSHSPFKCPSIRRRRQNA